MFLGFKVCPRRHIRPLVISKHYKSWLLRPHLLLPTLNQLFTSMSLGRTVERWLIPLKACLYFLNFYFVHFLIWALYFLRMELFSDHPTGFSGQHGKPVSIWQCLNNAKNSKKFHVNPR